MIYSNSDIFEELYDLLRSRCSPHLPHVVLKNPSRTNVYRNLSCLLVNCSSEGKYNRNFWIYLLQNNDWRKNIIGITPILNLRNIEYYNIIAQEFYKEKYYVQYLYGVALALLKPRESTEFFLDILQKNNYNNTYLISFSLYLESEKINYNFNIEMLINDCLNNYGTEKIDNMINKVFYTKSLFSRV